jgi:moderate conductance mechanosensitive channel
VRCYNPREMYAPPDVELQEFWRNWEHDTLYWVRHDAPTIVVALVVAFVLLQMLHLLTSRLLRFAERETTPASRRRMQIRTIATIINSFGMAIIVFIAGLQILKAVHFDIAPLLASAGIAGLAIGFGAQTLVKDVLNGFLIVMENQYDLGDIISIGGVKGTVETMTLRRTVLRDADGSVHIVPNSEIHVVSNLTRDWTQVTLHVAVAYKEPSDRVIGLLQDVARDIRNDPDFAEALVADPQVPGIERVSGGEVDYLLIAKTRPSDQYRVSRELRRRIKECFQKNNIEPARPAQLYVVDAMTEKK